MCNLGRTNGGADGYWGLLHNFGPHCSSGTNCLCRQKEMVVVRGCWKLGASSVLNAENWWPQQFFLIIQRAKVKPPAYACQIMASKLTCSRQNLSFRVQSGKWQRWGSNFRRKIETKSCEALPQSFCTRLHYFFRGPCWDDIPPTVSHLYLV